MTTPSRRWGCLRTKLLAVVLLGAGRVGLGCGEAAHPVRSPREPVSEARIAVAPDGGLFVLDPGAGAPAGSELVVSLRAVERDGGRGVQVHVERGRASRVTTHSRTRFPGSGDASAASPGDSTNWQETDGGPGPASAETEITFE